MNLSDKDIDWLILATRFWAEEYTGAAPESEIEQMDELRARLKMERDARGQ